MLEVDILTVRTDRVVKGYLTLFVAGCLPVAAFPTYVKFRVIYRCSFGLRRSGERIAFAVFVRYSTSE
jgi:hypothetical protein